LSQFVNFWEQLCGLAFNHAIMPHRFNCHVIS